MLRRTRSVFFTLSIALFLALIPAAHAQVSYNGTQTILATLGTGVTISPITVDAAGDIFFVEHSGSANTLCKIPKGGSLVTLSAVAELPTTIAVDALGTQILYAKTSDTAPFLISTTASSTGVQLPGAFLTIFSYGHIASVHFEGSIGLVIDSSNRCWKIPTVTASAKPTAQILITGLGANLAIGGTGNTLGFLINETLHTLLQVNLTGTGTLIPVSIATSVPSAVNGLAADVSGNVFIGNGVGGTLKEVLSGGSIEPVTSAFVNGTTGIGVDSSANVYVGGYNDLDLAIVVQLGGGATAAVDFGSVLANGGTATEALNFTIDAGTTVGSINFLTSGIQNKYYVDGGATTCLEQTYADATDCVVSVKFQPLFTGAHSGAVTLGDGSGSVLATAYLHGQSTGPQLAFGPAPTAAFGTGYTDPVALAVDPKANVFVADSSAGTLTRIDTSGFKTVIDSSLTTPVAIALDGAGNIFVADTGALKVYKETQAGVRTNFAPLVLHPAGVAVDPAGNVYIDDGLLGTIAKVTPGGAVTTLTLNVLTSPGPMALDASGNLYVITGGTAIIKITPAGTETSFATGLSSANGIAVDAAGSVYVSDLSSSRPVIYRYSAAGVKSTLLAPATTLSTATGGLAIHLDSNVFYGVGGTGATGTVQVLSRLNSTPLTFPTVTPGGTTDTTDGPLGESILNVGNTTYTLSAITYPKDFPASGTGGHDCTSSTSLAPSASC